MRKLLTVVLAFALIPVGIAAGVALADEGGEEKVTLCHAAGLAGTTHYVTLTVGRPAAFGPAGHFFENGTPQAGHEQDYLGACEGDETTPTETTPTTTTPTTTTPTTTTPTTTTPTTPTETVPVSGSASVICDSGAGVYRVSGTIDGQAADTVIPATIPGSFAGTVNVIVTRGDTAFRTSVTTSGDCGSRTTTTPPANSTQPTPPVTSTTTTTTPSDITAGPPSPGAPAEEDTTGQPAEANPPASSPGQPAEANPPKGAPITPAPGEPCPPGTTEWRGKCNANVMGSG
jgi:hypothetical protein